MAGRRDNYLKIKAHLSKTPGAKILYTDWQDRAATSLLNLVNNNKLFIRDVRKLRLNKKMGSEEKALMLINKYNKQGLRIASIDIVRYYVETDKIHPHYMRPPVIAVSTKENIAGPSILFNNAKELKKRFDEEFKKYPNNWVFLVLEPDCTKEDMKEWVENNWDWFLQDRLDAIKPYVHGRVKPSKNTKRDMEIYEHIKIHKKPAQEMVNRYELEPSYVHKIANRIEKSLKKQTDK